MKIVLTVDWHNIVVCKWQVLYLLILHVFNILESNMCHNMHLSWYVYRLSVFRLQVVYTVVMQSHLGVSKTTIVLRTRHSQSSTYDVLLKHV